jgi:hypothetical protein
MSITYSERMFVAVGFEHVMPMRYTVMCGLPGSTTFFHFFSKGARFFEKKVIEYKTRVLIFSTTFVLHISHSKEN